MSGQNEERKTHNYLRTTGWLFRFLLPDWWVYAFSVLLTLARAAWPVATAWNIAMFVDSAAKHDPRLLRVAVIAGFVIYGGMAVSDALLQVVRRVVITGMIHRLRTLTLDRALRAPLRVIGVYKAGDVENRISADSAHSTNAITWQMINALTAPVQGISAFCYLLTVNKTIAVLVLMLGPIVGVIFWLIMRLVQRNQTALREAEAGLNDYVQDNWRGALIIRCYQMQAHALHLCVKRLVELFRLDMRLALVYAVGFGGLSLVVSAVWLFSFYLGLLDTETGQMTPGQLTAVMSLVMIIQGSFAQLGSFWPELQKSLVSGERLREIADLEQEEEPLASQEPAVTEAPAIEFQDVSFSYGGKDPQASVLTGISFSVPPGSRVALVGKTGSGKTTVLKLLLGLYKPDSGCILIDRTNLDDFPLSRWRASVAYVPQEGYLFIGSLKDNITVGSAISDECIQSAIRLAYLEPVLEAHDGNLDLDVGERGARLSGGEIQRVTLARAFARKAPLLLLDESTSSLDSRAEAFIEQGLQELLKHRSCLVVAHRLSTVKKADLILVMEKGRIVERGTHAELMGLGGHYTELCGSLL